MSYNLKITTHNWKTHLLLGLLIISAILIFRNLFHISEKEVEASVVTVNFTESGFSPGTVTITAGDSVLFVNQTENIVDVESNAHPTHTDYSALNVGNVGAGSSVTTAPLTQIGTWGYHDHIGPSTTGTIIIVAAGGVGGCSGDCSAPGILSFSETASGSSLKVDWITDELSITKFEYGPYPFLKNKILEPDSEFILEHSVLIQDLKPNSLYHYRVHTKDKIGNNYVTPAEGHVFKFLPPSPIIESATQPLEQKPLPAPVSELKITVPSIKIASTLRLGSTGREVRELQQILAKDTEIYPEGLITGYFGPLTEQAVKRFQEKYGIIDFGTSSTTGYGLVGPKTRAILNKLQYQ